MASLGLRCAAWVTLLCLVTASGAAGASDGYRTEVIGLKSMGVDQAIALHQRLIGDDEKGWVVPGPRPGQLLAHDSTRRLARFKRLLSLLDQGGSGSERIYVRPVVHLAPSQLAKLLSQVFDADGRQPKLTMVADDRASRLVVRAAKRRYLVLDRLIRRLDVPLDRGGRAIRILPKPPGELF